MQVLSIPALVARSLISAEQATIYTTLLEQVAAVRTGLAAGTSSISISSTGGSSSGSGSSGGSTGRRRSERAGGGGKGGLVSSADAAVLQALKVATAELNPAIASAIQGDLAQVAHYTIRVLFYNISLTVLCLTTYGRRYYLLL